MAKTYLGQTLNISDEVVYLKNIRTGSSTIRKCKCIGIVRKINGKNVDIECVRTERSYFNEVSEEHRVIDDEIICILGAETPSWRHSHESPKEE